MIPYSVVIPAWNAASTIVETLQSVAAQTQPPAEIILADDGSTDDTVDVANRSGVALRFLRLAHAGPGAATTAGIAAASTGYVATLDSDDLWLPHKMRIQLAFMHERPELMASFGHMQAFRGSPADGLGRPVPAWARSTMLVRPELLERVGPLVDLPAKVGDMIDWLARAREMGFAIGLLPDVLAYRRIRTGSLSHASNVDRNRGYVAAARNALLRRAPPKEPR